MGHDDKLARIKEIVDTFGVTTLVQFSDEKSLALLKVGRLREHDVALNMRSGHLKIPGCTSRSSCVTCTSREQGCWA